MSIKRYPSEMTPDQLVDEALELSEALQQGYLSEARKEVISRRLGHVLFEYRYQNGDFEDAVA